MSKKMNDTQNTLGKTVVGTIAAAGGAASAAPALTTLAVIGGPVVLSPTLPVLVAAAGAGFLLKSLWDWVTD